jgi:hypothetical protein
MSEHRPWWEEIHLCKGITKKGKRCKKPARKPYEKESGNLVIPLTCSLHADQEERLIYKTFYQTLSNNPTQN